MCLLISFITPFVDRGIPSLPIKGSDEFQPFIGRLSEFQLWYAMTKAFTLSITMTFFSICDVAFILPILLCFWLSFTLAFMIMMTSFIIKYRYLPFTIGKQGIRW